MPSDIVGACPKSSAHSTMRFFMRPKLKIVWQNQQENQPVLSLKHLTLRNNWIADSLLLFAIFLIFYTFWLGSYPLFTPDEGRYGEVAREMLVSHDFITPRVNGVAFLDKPVLYYWLEATAIALFGIKEWALRLFPALLGVASCLIMYYCGRRLFDRKTGLLSAIILATSPLYFISAHYANLDLEVAIFISASLLFFITGVESHPISRRFLIAAYVFAALASLTKGLIGIVFPALIIGIWIALSSQWKLLLRMHLIKGLMLFTIIVLPWYYLAQQANPQFLHYFFVTQHVTRFLSTGEFNNPIPFWFYLPVVCIGFLPWTAFLIQAITHPTRSRIKLFLLIWIAVVFVFFSIPHSKIITYILPLFPALALLVGHYLATQYSSLRLFITLVVLNTLVLLTLVFCANHFNPHSTKSLVTTLKTIMEPQDEVINYYKFYQDLPLYLEKRITLVADWNSPTIANKDNWIRELWYGMPFQNTDDWLISEKIFWEKWHQPKRVFVFLGENYFDQFKKHSRHYYFIAKKNDILLLSNQPTIVKIKS